MVLSMTPIALCALHWYEVAWMAEEYLRESNGSKCSVRLSAETERTSL